MRFLSLDDLLDRATPYESWPARLDDRLRAGMFMSLCSSLLMLPVYSNWPPLQDLFGAPLLLLGGTILDLLERLKPLAPALLALNLGGLACFLVLVVGTQGLRSGRPFWHWLAAGQVVLGLPSGLVLAAMLVVVVFNLALWLALVALVLRLGFGRGG